MQNRLRELRMAKGLSLRELSAKTGVDFATISFCEKGQRRFSQNSLEKLVKFFGVSADYLLGWGNRNYCVDEIQTTDKPDKNYFRKTNLGYVQVYMPESAMAGKGGWVFLHRVVMAKSIGRDLRPEEVVHHIDGDPGNNALSNLMLFPNNAEHRRYHGKMTRDKKIEELLKK